MLTLGADQLFEIVRFRPDALGKLAQVCVELRDRMGCVSAMVDANIHVDKHDLTMCEPHWEESFWCLDVSWFGMADGCKVLHGPIWSQYGRDGIMNFEATFRFGGATGQWRARYDPPPMRSSTAPYYIMTGYFDDPRIPQYLIFVRKYAADGLLMSIKMQIYNATWSAFSRAHRRQASIMKVWGDDSNGIFISKTPTNPTSDVLSLDHNSDIGILDVTDEFLANNRPLSYDHPSYIYGIMSSFMHYDARRVISSDDIYVSAARFSRYHPTNYAGAFNMNYVD